MSDTNNPGDKTQTRAPSKPLTVKRPVEQGTVRQSFSHGRSKSVVVETVKRRTIGAAPGAVAPREPAAPPPRPASVAPAPAPPARPAGRSASGVVLRTLSEQERDARAAALADAQRRHDNAVAEAEQEASRIRDDARSDATRIREEMTEQTEHEVARIHQRGEEQLTAERDAAVRKLRSETGSMSMQLAQRIIEESMADEGEKRASVDGFLDDLDGLGGSGSGTRQPAQAGGGVS